jgi:hypothetical protein
VQMSARAEHAFYQSDFATAYTVTRR